MDKIKEAQEKLYTWLSCFEKKSYNSIRQNCDYLNIQYSLGIDNYAVWQIFYPLVYSGVVDHVGNGYFALTEPLIMDFKSHYIVCNPDVSDNLTNTDIIGIYITDNKENLPQCKISKFDSLQALKTYPTIKSIVDNYFESIVDEQCFEYHNYKTKKGVAEFKDGGLVRYFSVPDIGYQRQIPDKTINPDGLNIAYCYERVVNQQNNGVYTPKDKQLKLLSFGLPIMIHRVLLLDMLSRREYPKMKGYEYIYSNVNPRIVKELNRIYCNTIIINE